MSKQNKNIFEKITEALNTATEEFATTNNYLFGIGAELSNINSKLGDLSDNIAKYVKATEDKKGMTVLSNRAPPLIWSVVVEPIWRGKFFKSGARGLLKTINIYCKNTGSTDESILVMVSPEPAHGSVEVAHTTISIPANSTEAWRTATFNQKWDYDTLFIYIIHSSKNVFHAFDEGSPADAYWSDDHGRRWHPDSGRGWFDAVIETESLDKSDKQDAAKKLIEPTIPEYKFGEA